MTHATFTSIIPPNVIKCHSFHQMWRTAHQISTTEVYSSSREEGKHYITPPHSTDCFTAFNLKHTLRPPAWTFSCHPRAAPSAESLQGKVWICYNAGSLHLENKFQHVIAYLRLNTPFPPKGICIILAEQLSAKQ